MVIFLNSILFNKMSLPASWWTKVALCDSEDETSNKYYVMLSQKDYERYSSDPEYAKTLLEKAKNQAIINTMHQKDGFDENSEIQDNSENADSILGFQFVASSSPQKIDEKETKTTSRSPDGKWSIRATNLLVELVKQNSVGLRSRNVKKIVYWKKICELLKKRNYNFKWKQVQKKWCNLFKTYKHVKVRKLLPNKKKGISKIPLWPYMDIFDEIYENDPKIARIVSIVEQPKNPTPAYAIDYRDLLETNEPTYCSSESSNEDKVSQPTLKVQREKNIAKELNDIHKLLLEKSQREDEALTILKNLAEKSVEQEDKRTRAIETLTSCVTQLTDTIKSLINKQ